jgi:hypothetical protein
MMKVFFTTFAVLASASGELSFEGETTGDCSISMDESGTTSALQSTCCIKDSCTTSLADRLTQLEDKVDALDLKVTALASTAAPTASPTDLSHASCLAWLNAGATQSGLYTINPTGSAPVEAYCDMHENGGGWTLVLNALGNGQCRTQLRGGTAAIGTPFGISTTATSAGGSVLKLSDADINALGATAYKQEVDGASYSVGQNFKFIHPQCNWHPQDDSMNSPGGNCFKYALSYADAQSGSWTVGDSSQCGSSCVPFGTNGGGNEINGAHERTSGQDNILSTGLFDSANCFDAWGFGTARQNRIWAK